MSSDNPLFQTPNPTELKDAADKDPIQEKYPDRQAKPNRDEQVSDAEVNQAGAAEMTNSPIVNANLSGH